MKALPRLAFLFAVTAGFSTNAAEPEKQSAKTGYSPAWTWDRRVNDAALSPAADCVAAAVSDAVAVMDPRGKVLWQWEFAKKLKFVTAGRIAIAPSCRMIAFTGGSSYRYTWIVHRDGRRIPIKMQATPLGVAISPDGNVIAIGTGANDVWLFDSDGTMRWRTHVGLCCVVSDLSFAQDGHAIFVNGWGSAVLSLTGEVKWNPGHTSMWAAPNGKTFIGYDEPPHGPGLTSFAVMDETGKELWSRLGSPGIATLQGDVIAASVEDNQEPAIEDMYKERPAKLKLMSRSGEVVATLPGEGTPVALSQDARTLIVRNRFETATGYWADRLEALDRGGTSLWSIPLGDYTTRAIVSPDLKTILVWSLNKMSWYTPG